MTSDYTSEAVGLQGWERALNEDAYFAGEEDLPYVDSSEEMPFFVSSGAQGVSIGCQTASQWKKSVPAQKAKEAVRELPAPRLVILRPGMQDPNPRLSHPRTI